MFDPDRFGPTLGGPPEPTDLPSLALVVEQQRGLVTTGQCLGAGMTPDAVRHRLRCGRWAAVHRGVHQTVPGREGWWWDATAALLAVGTGAAWAFQTAAYAEGLVGRPPRQTHLLVHARHTPEAPRCVVVHRSRWADDRVDDLRWPWRTRVEETVLDLAETGTVDEVAALLGRALQRGRTTEGQVLARLAARRRHSRRALLRDLLADVAAGAESAMEVRYLRDVERAHGLPRGTRQLATFAGGERVHDVGHVAEAVLLELDGRLGHEGRPGPRRGP